MPVVRRRHDVGQGFWFEDVVAVGVEHVDRAYGCAPYVIVTWFDYRKEDDPHHGHAFYEAFGRSSQDEEQVAYRGL